MTEEQKDDQNRKWDQEFIDSIKDPELKAKLIQENEVQAAYLDAIEDIDPEAAALLDEFKLFLYYQPPFDWDYWMEMFNEATRAIGYQVLHRKMVEDWANIATACGNLEYAGDLLKPYDQGKTKAEAELARQKFQEILEKRWRKNSGKKT